MIFILTNETDESTHHVIDWLNNLTEDYFRINGGSLLEHNLVVKLDKTAEKVKFSIILNDKKKREITSDCCKVVWYRRWAIPKNFVQDYRLSSVNYQITRYIQIQFNSLFEMLCNSLSQSKWLNHPSDLKLNKLLVLEKASELGLIIPETIICTNKKELEQFQELHSNIITKSISDVAFFYNGGNKYGLYTSEIAKGDIEVIEESFFPSLVQKKINKVYEIRIFYLDGLFYSMAIFSQNCEDTKTDFRQKSNTKPIRTVPYLLPKSVEKILHKLMKALKMSCGSIDMIKDLNGNYIFLEINPVGQFGMVSFPCNYFLEKKLSEHLFKWYKDHEK